MNYVVPYKMGSKSAKSLAAELRVKQSRGIKKFRPGTKVINWGNSQTTLMGRRLTVANRPEAVARASNKLTSLSIMKSHGVSVVDFTTNRMDAFSWAEEGSVVYGRALLNAHSGRGIKILDSEGDFPTLPLYTRGVLKAHEYRVHVMFGEIIDFSKKRKRSGAISNSLIKNLDNGWVFCRDNVVLPDLVSRECLKAVRSLGLDFGAVDVLFRERENKAFVLEVNTAPGLEGTTLKRYSNKLLNWLRY